MLLGIGLGFFFAPGEGMVVIGIALSSTALGTLMPILRDARELDSPFGRAISAIGAVGEFLPLIAISIFLSTRTTPIATAVLLTFVVLAGLAVLLATRVSHGRLHRIVRATLHTSDQFGVRFVILLIAALVGLSVMLDLDMLLGAFVAGAIWRIIMARAPKKDAEEVESKIEAIAFGFLVPIFFLYTGVTFDLQALLTSPSALALVPIFLIALLVIRGSAAQLSAPPGASARDRAALGLLAATGLPIIVAVTAIGVDQDMIDTGTAAALVGAGMLSVLLYPLIGMTLRGDRAEVVGPERAAESTQENCDHRIRTLDPGREGPAGCAEGGTRRAARFRWRGRRIVRVGDAWHLGVLLLTETHALATAEVLRAADPGRRGYTAESARSVPSAEPRHCAVASARVRSCTWGGASSTSTGWMPEAPPGRSP